MRCAQLLSISCAEFVHGPRRLGFSENSSSTYRSNRAWTVVICASRSLLMCLASRICLVVMGPYISASNQASSCPLSSMALPTALNAAITVCISPNRSTHLPLQSSLLISSCLAHSYKAMPRVITVLLLGPNYRVVDLLCLF